MHTRHTESLERGQKSQRWNIVSWEQEAMWWSTKETGFGGRCVCGGGGAQFLQDWCLDDLFFFLGRTQLGDESWADMGRANLASLGNQRWYWTLFPGAVEP